MLDRSRYFLRMARSVHRYLQAQPIADPEAAVRERLERREVDFIANVKRVIFDDPANPYHQLFQAAGCEFGDFSDSIARNGLEPTLAALHKEGVFVAHDEFKGRRPIVRRGVEIHANPDSFANPFVEALSQGTSSGSTGRPTAVRKGLEVRLYREAYEHFVAREHGVNNGAHADLKPILPVTEGINSVLRRAKYGRGESKWFSPAGSWRESGHYRLATYGLLLTARLSGTRAGFPSFLSADDYTPVARWLAERRRRGVSCSLSSMVSPACRVAAAAIDHGLDISGSTFFCGGEALSEVKRALLVQAGVRPVISYWISEIGVIGRACRQMTSGNRVHQFHDSMAVISHRRQAPLADVELNSLLFTTLLPFTPILVINAEMEDSAVIAPARCDCLLSRTGWTTEIGDIQSFGKLTGHGITLLGNDLVRILEEELPRHFGGRPGDFQLAERDGARQTEVDLRVSPRLAGIAPDLVRDYFFQQIRGKQGGMPAEWVLKQSDALRVVVEEPIATGSGKVHPLRLLGASRQPSPWTPKEQRHAS